MPPNGEILVAFLLPLGFESAFQLLEKGMKVYLNSVAKPQIKDRNLGVSFRLGTLESSLRAYPLHASGVFPCAVDSESSSATEKLA